jgi:enoyl-CoA hydratase/carnithine racemase
VIHAETRGHVVAVTIDRADHRNAVDHETLDELAAVLEFCGDDVRPLALTGAGGHFCAGLEVRRQQAREVLE